jgi:hypothetical protein
MLDFWERLLDRVASMAASESLVSDNVISVTAA